MYDRHESQRKAAQPSRFLLVTALTLAAAAGAGCAGTPVRQPPERAIQSAPLPAVISGPQEGFDIAIGAFRQGDMEKAAFYARSVEDQFPHTPWQQRALFLYGRTLIARGRTDEAQLVMLRIPVDYPDLAEYALFSLAEYDAAKQRLDESAALFRRIIEDYPSSAIAPQASLRAGQVLYASGLCKDAAAVFARTVRDYPHSDQAAVAAIGLGQALADAGNLPGAVAAYRAVRIDYPGNANDAAAEAALTALALRGAEVPSLSADELYVRAINLYRISQYDKSVSAFLAVLESDPSHPRKADILLRTGIALYNLGRRQEAASTLKQLLSARLPGCRCDEALYWLGKSYSRLGLYEQAVDVYRKLLKSFPDSKWADNALYSAGNVHRDAGDRKEAVRYYRRLVETYPDSSFADSALWWEGWSLYTAGSYTKARNVMRELVWRYPRSFLVNQALYWQGRAAENIGDQAGGQKLYRRVVTRGPYTFYGYRAAERLDAAGAVASPVTDAAWEVSESGTTDAVLAASEDVQDPEESDGSQVWSDEAIAALSSSSQYRKTLELMYLDMKPEAAAELRRLRDRMPANSRALIGVSKAFFELGDYYNSLTIVLRNFERSLERPSQHLPDDLWLLAYPQGYWQDIVSASKRYELDPFFVAAVIREESRFRPEALSSAGARGVMQVMPSTGEWIARNAGMTGFDRSQLFDAGTNISVGAWYLSRLVKRFQGDLYRASAAYNAGPEAVASWQETRAEDPVLFVETIPYRETRSYVKKVIRNYEEYHRLYEKAGAVALSQVTTGPSLSVRTAPVAATMVCKAPGDCSAPSGGR